MAALQSIRVIRRKLRSVNNIRKITRAMEMVSAAKLKKVQERLMELRPYADKIKELVEGLLGTSQVRHPLLMPRERIQSVGVILITADKGLCGAFNSNMLRFFENFLESQRTPIEAIAIGRKGMEFLRKQRIRIISSYTNIPTEVPFDQVRKIIQEMIGPFERGLLDEVYIFYTEYINALTFKPRMLKFLPVEKERLEKRKLFPEEYIFEPHVSLILERLLPRYIQTSFHRILLESFSSEHAARMNAMRNATENADELIESLTLTFNKARQAGITKELLDIIGGAEALR
jgi:F-type H+-transporting ATPase subunit gamma